MLQQFNTDSPCDMFAAEVAPSRPPPVTVEVLTTLTKVTFQKMCMKLYSAVSVFKIGETRCMFDIFTVDCGGRLAKAPYSAPTTYQVEPDVCGQYLIFLILILLNERTPSQEWNNKTL